MTKAAHRVFLTKLVAAMDKFGSAEMRIKYKDTPDLTKKTQSIIDAAEKHGFKKQKAPNGVSSLWSDGTYSLLIDRTSPREAIVTLKG